MTCSSNIIFLSRYVFKLKGKKSMIKIELDEKDVFKIMVGSMEDRINLLISESVMKEIDLKTIKEIVEMK